MTPAREDLAHASGPGGSVANPEKHEQQNGWPADSDEVGFGDARQASLDEVAREVWGGHGTLTAGWTRWPRSATGAQVGEGHPDHGRECRRKSSVRPLCCEEARDMRVKIIINPAAGQSVPVDSTVPEQGNL
jgi:hypothetical protein